MAQTNRKYIAALSAALLWLAIHAFFAVPCFLDLKTLPIYLGGVVLFLEPLVCFWVYYQYRYMVRAEIKSNKRDELDA